MFGCVERYRLKSLTSFSFVMKFFVFIQSVQRAPSMPAKMRCTKVIQSFSIKDFIVYGLVSFPVLSP